MILLTNECTGGTGRASSRRPISSDIPLGRMFRRPIFFWQAADRHGVAGYIPTHPPMSRGTEAHMPSPPFAVNDADVSHNAFGDEVIVIHFTTGEYFSLRGTAAAIWHALATAPASAETLLGLFD